MRWDDGVRVLIIAEVAERQTSAEFVASPMPGVGFRFAAPNLRAVRRVCRLKSSRRRESGRNGLAIEHPDVAAGRGPCRNSPQRSQRFAEESQGCRRSGVGFRFAVPNLRAVCQSLSFDVEPQARIGPERLGYQTSERRSRTRAVLSSPQRSQSFAEKSLGRSRPSVGFRFAAPNLRATSRDCR
jgi:hypothetical protein